MLIKALARTLLMLLALLAPSAFAASLYSAPRYAAILIDNNTGEVLYARRADEARYPASITKVMTLYVAFEEVAAGRLRLDDDIRISRRAWGQAPSKLGLRVGATISVKDAFGVIATKSANDIAVALAEHISGSEAAFAERMTATARRLGMMNTVFRNASGLPNPDHITTARDIATLSRAMLRNFPDFYPVFSQAQYRYRGMAVENHNHLLRTMPGVDGIKTGFTNAAGFTLAASAVRGDRRLVAVVLGGPSRLGRDDNMQDLLNIGFDVLDSRLRGQPFTVASRFAEPDDLPDAVMESLAGDEVAEGGAVDMPTRATRAVDVASAITALGDTGLGGSSLASVRSGGGRALPNR
ncbi:D-alanyl-D-alanine carboxypeptidase family protein [Sandarakinorhabdus oryzae]|uniref:D-alanyl-D-alanine carboxypeptidase family protein n=1 Tax=Sandarakinorhabdus oryzae TaxID=2675220 RepID=UPI001F2594BD|nr:D-alanyl-D-alanine carboxypeptidase family protein [Sandarakinorhabdus oryzae]